MAPELVGYFRAQLAGHYTADMYLGPRYLIPVVQVEAELIARLAGEARDDQVRQGLLDAGTAYAAMLGWLYQDAGDLSESARWRNLTLDMAHRAGDPDLISYALSNKAMLAADQNNGRVVLDFALGALADAGRLSPKARVIALQHAAQGKAMLGDRDGCARLIDTAAALLSRVDDEHPWGNACRRTPNWAETQRATCYGKAGDYDEITERLAKLPGWQRAGNEIWRAFTTTYHECIHFAVYVAAKAQEVSHHPDIHITWQRIEFRITTHDAGHRLTEADFKLAKEIDAIANRRGAVPEDAGH